MSKRFLRNQLAQILSQKCLTTLKKFDIINHTFPIPVFLPPAADGPCADNRGQKAGPKWLEQYVAKQTNSLVFNSQAQPVMIDAGCAFCSLEIVTLRGGNKKTGLRQNASTASLNPVLHSSPHYNAGLCLLRSLPTSIKLACSCERLYNKPSNSVKREIPNIFQPVVSTLYGFLNNFLTILPGTPTRPPHLTSHHWGL